MKISFNQLKKYINGIEDPKEIESLITFKLCEVESVEELGDDFVFDLKILPDRAGDLLSHIGIAREVASLLGKEINLEEVEKIDSVETKLKIDVKTEKCKRYMGRIVRNVSISESPDWMKDFLNLLGEKSINNIVDASNIIMFKTGHPVHVFDLKKIKDEHLIINEADIEEKFITVGGDNKEVIIKNGDILVSDKQNTLALAGIKGGVNSGLESNFYTTDILLEVASFDSVQIRKTGQRIGIYTDARKRFENGVSPFLSTDVMDKLSSLILSLSPDAYFEDIVDVSNIDLNQHKRQVSFTLSIINEKLGLNLTQAHIVDFLNNYKYEYLEENGNFIVFVPFFREDIVGIHNFVDEIGRFYGYEKIEPVFPNIESSNKDNGIYLKIEAAKRYLIGLDFKEVMTYSLVKKGEVEVLYGPKGKNFLRTNILNSLNESYELNRLNSPLLGEKEMKVFEVGTVFKQNKEEINIALIDKKNKEEYQIDEFIDKYNIEYKDIDISNFNIKNISKFKMWSLYPFIVRDISVWVKEGISENEVLDILNEVQMENVILGPELFDSFRKDNKISYAFRIVFCSFEKTLKEEDTKQVVDSIYKKLESNGFEIR
jgi:phenylalanyl-tRNA synthetase beta subunit